MGDVRLSMRSAAGGGAAAGGGGAGEDQGTLLLRGGERGGRSEAAGDFAEDDRPSAGSGEAGAPPAAEPESERAPAAVPEDPGEGSLGVGHRGGYRGGGQPAGGLCVALRPLDGRGVPAHAVGGGYRHGMVGRGGNSWALAGGDPGRAGSLRGRLPFRIREIHPDNDTGMINDLLWRYCQKAKIKMSRSRPYQKNDNAWVEQRNWTHVRKVVGYRRMDTSGELLILRELYANLTLHKNFFQPTMKRKEKLRVGGKIHRKYDEPKTPYQRLLESGQISV